MGNFLYHTSCFILQLMLQTGVSSFPSLSSFTALCEDSEIYRYRSMAAIKSLGLYQGYNNSPLQFHFDFDPQYLLLTLAALA